MIHFHDLLHSLLPIPCRFDEKESISGSIQLKSSVQKGIRAKILEQFPHLESYMEAVLPKKDNFKLLKWYGSRDVCPPCDATQLSLLSATNT